MSPTNINPTIYLKDYQKPEFLIPEVMLDFALNQASTLVVATMQVKRSSGSGTPLVLHGEKMQLVSLAINGKTLSDAEYQIDAESLTILNVPDAFELEVQTELLPHLNTELSGLYQSSGNFCTQCEAEGFRRITYFLDRPDVLSVYRVRLTADVVDCPVLLSNGNPVASGRNDDNTHWAEWFDPHPKPSYLFALVAGNLEHVTDHFTTASGNKVELNIYAQQHNIEKCDHAMASLKKSMRWDEDVYGREYDLDIYNIVAVDDFNMGAMENKGLNVFNSKYVLANQDTATDLDYEGIESVIAHEYFHNWSGNRVTCRDWFQLSLKEGFTVFRDQEFSADMGSRAVKRIRDVQSLRAFQFKEDAGPMAHPVRPDSYQEINNFYTSTIYQKGAEVIRMMRELVGVEGFRRGTDLYFDRFDGQAVTTEDFVTSIEQANDIDLAQFRLWYTQSGTPSIRVQQSYTDQTLTLTIQQSCPATPGQDRKRPFQMPLCIALLLPSGEKVLQQTLVLTEDEQSFEFSGLPEQPVVSMLRGFSAPVKLEYNQSDDELLTLVSFDDDGFVRWEAMQRLCLKLLLPAVENGSINEAAYSRVRDAFLKLLTEPCHDKAMLAEMLSLPTASYLAELSEAIEPRQISLIRQQCVQRLAKDLESPFHTVYAQQGQNTDFSLDAESMASRSLKNRTLMYLVATGQPAYYALASHQYHAANTMTDRLSAFTALVHSSYPDRQALIDHFYQQWKDDPLVMDKWFAMQAIAPRDNLLPDIEQLMSNPTFSINNPNKVRSLIGAFTSNLLAFHQQDGAGYKFLVDCVIQLNTINPQVAARLISTINNWRRYAQPYQSLMCTQLERLANENGLASDVTEIVSKALK